MRKSPTQNIWRFFKIFCLNILNLSGLKDLTGLNLQITNTTGKVLHQSQKISTLQTFDLSNYPNGVYFIKIQTENGVYTEKIIKN